MGDRPDAMMPSRRRRRPAVFILLGAAGLLFTAWWNCLSPPLFQAPYSTVLNDRHGTLLGARIAADEQWRFPPSDSLPEKFVKAIVAFEDQRFQKHHGVDVRAVLRAIRQNIQAGRVVSGASTLTMQVVRLSQGHPERSWRQKLMEMAQALRLESLYCKEEILSLYCAHAPFGGNIVGLEAASWRYYGVPAEHLSWGEAAALAVLPNAPSTVLPGRNEDVFRGKRDRLLDRLLQQEHIDSVVWRLSKAEPLPGRPLPLPRRAPHALDWQCQELPSTRCNSTIDRSLQSRIQEVVDGHVDIWRGNLVSNAAAVAVHLQSGEIRAYAGNTTSKEVEGAAFDMLREPRSTGSILKPFLYAAAMEDGNVTPHALLEDVPTRIGDFTPHNFDRVHRGAPTVRTSLIESLNVPAVRLLRDFGVEKFHGRLRGLGMSDLNNEAVHYGLSLILGGAEIQPLQIAAVYAAFFSPLLIGEVPPLSDPFGRTLGMSDPAVFDALTTLQVAEIMADVKRPPEWQHWQLQRPVHWKTGTSYGHRDAWAVGSDGQWLVVVWTGNASQEGRPGLIGVESSAPLFFKVLNQLPFDGSEFPTTEAILEGRQVSLCAATGMGKGPFCGRERLARVGGLTPQTCKFCRVIQVDEEGARVHNGCGAELKDSSWVILPPAMQWYHSQNGGHFPPLPPWSSSCGEGEGVGSEQKMEWVYPEGYEVVKRPRDLDGQLQGIVLEVAHTRPEARLFWHDNDLFIGETEGYHVREMRFSPGIHKVKVVDDEGVTLSATLKVVE